MRSGRNSFWRLLTGHPTFVVRKPAIGECRYGPVRNGAYTLLHECDQRFWNYG